MKKQDFKSRQEYADYLFNLLKSMKREGDYNIFTHCVSNYSRYNRINSGNPLTPEAEISEKLRSIQKNGLDLNGTQYWQGYASINGTMKFQGNTDVSDEELREMVEEIVSYNYFSDVDTVNTVILALPNYVQVDGKNYEFSTIDGTTDYFKGDSQFTANCLLDVIKNMYLPKEFCLGFQHVSKKKDDCAFVPQEEFIENISREKQIEFYFQIEESIKKIMQIYKATGLKDLVHNKNEELKISLNDFFNDP